MADPTPEQQQEQYAAIELLYSEGKWNEVLQTSEALLAALPPAQGHPLRSRLDLVIGHTLLYGLADLDAAEQRYRTVLLETEEPVLREIAEQGLLRCGEQRASSEAVEPMAMAVAAEEEPEITAPIADSVGTFFAEGTPGQPTAAAMPWETGVDEETPGIREERASGSSAAMPWLAELGIEPAAPAESFVAEAFAADPAANPAISDSVRTVRNVESTNVEELPQEIPAADLAQETNESRTTEETLALLREPEELIPVTVQVLEETAPLPQPAEPEPAKEEPPLSPDEMAELARGLLEVVLR